MTAVLSYLDRDCTLSLTENADREELTAFFAAMGYGTLLCTADFCMDRPYREGPMMQSVRRYDVQSGMAVFDSYPKLMDLYNFIDYDSQDFESWYVDLSHRIRHGGAKALTLRMDGMILASGILSSVTDKGAVLTAVRTQPEFRRMGYGSMLVRRLVADCKGTVYLMRELGRNEQFYLQNGFINHVKKGLDKERLDASLCQFAFRMRDRDSGGSPRSLNEALELLDTWLYGGDPAEGVTVEQPIRELLEKRDSGYFEELIRKLFLDNDHTVTVCMTQEQLDKELEKGYADFQERRTRLAEEVFEDIHERYGV